MHLYWTTRTKLKYTVWSNVPSIESKRYSVDNFKTIKSKTYIDTTVNLPGVIQNVIKHSIQLGIWYPTWTITGLCDDSHTSQTSLLRSFRHNSPIQSGTEQIYHCIIVLTLGTELFG